MDNEKFYEFRSRIRKKLGRIILLPKDIHFYADEITDIFQKDEVMTKLYLSKCTDNEIKALNNVLRYVKKNNENSCIIKILEENMPLN